MHTFLLSFANPVNLSNSKIFRLYNISSDLYGDSKSVVIGPSRAEYKVTINPFPKTPFLDSPKFKEAADDN